MKRCGRKRSNREAPFQLPWLGHRLYSSLHSIHIRSLPRFTGYQGQSVYSCCRIPRLLYSRGDIGGARRFNEKEMILHFLCDVDKGMEALLIDGRKIPSPGAIEGGRINPFPTRRCALHFRANRPCPKINTHSPFQRF
jgi:hypothetical protein